MASARAGSNVRWSDILISSKEPALPNSAIAPLCALMGPRSSLCTVKSTAPSLKSLHAPYAAKPYTSTSPRTLHIKFLVGTQQPTLDWVQFCNCFRKTLHLHSPHYLKLLPQHTRVNKCPPIHTEQTHLHSCNPLKLYEKSTPPDGQHGRYLRYQPYTLLEANTATATACAAHTASHPATLQATSCMRLSRICPSP